MNASLGGVGRRTARRYCIPFGAINSRSDAHRTWILQAPPGCPHRVQSELWRCRQPAIASLLATVLGWGSIIALIWGNRTEPPPPVTELKGN